MTSDEVRAAREATVREHMASENDREFDRTMAAFDHPRYELMASGEVFDGPEEVARYFQTSRAAFPDQRNELRALHHADGAVIAEFDLLGTHLGGPAPSGKAFRCPMIAVFAFDGDGTGIVCERVYWDNTTIRRQLSG